MKQVIENNSVRVAGIIEGTPELNHSVYGENFYTILIRVNRISDNYDVLPLTISERLVDIESLTEGTAIDVLGQFRSFNKDNGDGKKHLVLSIFVRELEFIEDFDEQQDCINQIEIIGYLCKEPHYRKTPLGREICDALFAVNRTYGKSDYLPSILWGRNAQYFSTKNVGEQFKIKGRIQSREYNKKISEEEFETRVAYEISVSQFEEIE